MALLLWALILVYAASVLLLVAGRLAARRSRLFRRFLVGDQAEQGWEQRAEAGWRRDG